MAAQPLTDGQVRQFKRAGALVLRGFIGRGTVDEWLRQWWAKTGACRDEPGSWPGAAPPAEWRLRPKLTEVPEVAALSTQVRCRPG